MLAVALILALLAQVTVTPKATGQVKTLCMSAVAVSAAADTNENVLATCTVPANALGANGMLRIWPLWTTTNSANNKTLRVRYSGAAGTQYLAQNVTTTVAMHHIVTISNRGATNSQVGFIQSTTIGLSSSTNANMTSAVDTTADTTVIISCQKALNTETCTLERYLVELILP